MAAEKEATGPNSALKEAQAAAAAGRPIVAHGDWQNDLHPCHGVNRVVDFEKGIVDVLMPDGKTPRRKFALVGFAGATRGQAPMNEPDWAIVGMNQLYRHIPRGDVWFEIHKEWNTAVVPGSDHEGWLRDCGLPIFMANRIKSSSTSVAFPLQRMISKFNDYFTSTVAYMLAWVIDHIDRLVEAELDELVIEGLSASAVVEKAREIYGTYQVGVFGIDLIVGSEYFEQKPCAEFWIGQACGRGITVMIPPQSALITQRYRYGYEMAPDDLVNDQDFARRIDELTKQHHEFSANAIRLAGMREEAEYWAELYRLRERGGKVRG